MDDISDHAGSYPNEFRGNGQMILRLRDSINPTTIHMIKRVRNVTMEAGKILFELFDDADWVWHEAELWRFQGVNAC